MEAAVRLRTFMPSAACACLFLCPNLLGQSPYPHQSVSPHEIHLDDDPAVILELGATTNWNTAGGAATFAPNLAAETTPIENWLEIEAGVSPFYTRSSAEWDIDLLFKKPWTISSRAEFMIGVGPSWAHTTQNGRTSNSVSGELAGDFMFWPSGRHRFGWFLEPAYDYGFAAGHPQSLGMSAGLLIGIPRRHR